MTRPWTVRLAAGLVAATAVLTGCSEKQEANETLPTNGAAETTPELPPLGPEDFPVPAEAREMTPEGAVAFVRYYVGLTKFVAENSLDPEPLLQLSQDCRTCIRIAQSLDEDRAANRRYTEYAYEFTGYGPAMLDGETAQMGFLYVQGPITVVDQAGKVVTDRSAPTPVELQSGAVLLWKPEQATWVITGLTVG
ncbi:hypothetical protein E4P40_05820 [Blastococcus sp. CT_GayMR20]|uniref:hypothetical protein n=1 Tax=Blastococcus sp. CT_GayMR20 TaxID=2559609 RepID=UPI0010735B3A|nr:hypothetical protein [Blastococcus sp. CT_GayMR20]TFV91544.1 hypothetical protein E4P40_05820 [Blastococcus sp. CT_GayMR20]